MTKIEYPDPAFESKRYSKVSINLKGELLLARADGWSSDLSPITALYYWPRILAQRFNAKQALEVVIRNARLHYLGPNAENHLPVVSSITQSLCCISQMMAWKKVFFAQSSSDQPKFYDDPLFSVQQKIHVDLASARQYMKSAELISPTVLQKPDNLLGYEDILTTKGCLFLIQQGAMFYHQYITQISKKLAHFMSYPDPQILINPIACDDVDWLNLVIILRYADNIALTPGQKIDFACAKQQIEQKLTTTEIQDLLQGEMLSGGTVVPTRNKYLEACPQQALWPLCRFLMTMFFKSHRP